MVLSKKYCHNNDFLTVQSCGFCLDLSNTIHTFVFSYFSISVGLQVAELRVNPHVICNFESLVFCLSPG